MFSFVSVSDPHSRFLETDIQAYVRHLLHNAGTYPAT